MAEVEVEGVYFEVMGCRWRLRGSGGGYGG